MYSVYEGNLIPTFYYSFGAYERLLKVEGQQFFVEFLVKDLMTHPQV